VGLFLAACAPFSRHPKSSALMIDCQYKINGHIHLHVSEERGSATLVSRYIPKSAQTHADDLRQGIESEGRMINPGNNLLKIDIFLLNDQLGETPGETVFISINKNGGSQIEAKAVTSGAVRLIDSGTCMVPKNHGV
jgi:hypothetical protein